MNELDYAVFAVAEFDPSGYANAVLAGDAYPPSSQPKQKASFQIQEPAKEDISIAISKLDIGIEDVHKQIKALVRVPPLASALNAS